MEKKEYGLDLHQVATGLYKMYVENFELKKYPVLVHSTFTNEIRYIVKVEGAQVELSNAIVLTDDICELANRYYDTLVRRFNKDKANEYWAVGPDKLPTWMEVIVNTHDN